VEEDLNDDDLTRLPSRWDVIIAGAGPAGSLTAILLARLGHEVLLIDRELFPRHKVCGCCLNGAAVRILKQAGQGRILQDTQASKLTSLVLEVSGRQGQLPLSENYALSRSKLDHALARAACDDGSAFLSGVAARLQETEKEFCRVRLQDRDSERVFEGRIVVCADGLKGSFLSHRSDLRSTASPNSRIGLAAIQSAPLRGHPPGTIRMAVGRHGYVGRVRVEDGSLNIAAAVDQERLRRHRPAAVLEKILMESGAPAIPGLGDLEWRGTPNLTRIRALSASRRLFIVGDALGYEEPFTGEGIAWALGGARLLVPIIADCLEAWQEDAPLRWTELVHRRVRKKQIWCRLIRRALRRPMACKAAFGFLNINPRLVTPFLNTINRPIQGT
jgi:flavin-dependent dehydrogenase